MELLFALFEWMAVTSWFFYLSIISIFGISYLFVRDSKDRDGFPFFPSLFIIGAIYISTLRFNSISTFIKWPNILYSVGSYLAVGFFVSLFKWVKKLSAFKADIKKRREDLMSGDKPDKLLVDAKMEYGYKSIGEIDGSLYLKPDASSIVRHWIYWPFFLISVVIDPIYGFVELLVSILKGFYTNISKSFSA